MRKLLRLLRRFFLLGLLLLAGVMLLNTLRSSSQQIATERIPPSAVAESAVSHLQEAIRIPTISLVGAIDTTAALDFDTLLRQTYPLVDSLLERIDISPYSQVFRWSGRKSALPPILLMGHSDVVPVDSNRVVDWEQGPFSGALTEGGLIWGRGTLDDKIAIIGVLEAIEQLLREDYWPERTVYLAFGHDEEISGHDGALAIAKYFASRDIRFEYVLDEGHIVLEEALPGLERPLAMIGVAEKGYVTLELKAQVAEGGHSSMPPSETATTILSKAIHTLQQHPFPARIDGATGAFFDYVGPEMSWPYRMLFANRRLLGGVLKMQFSGDPAANALMRTTTAPTIIQAGYKDNVIPTTATAMVNFRILPGDDIESVQAYVRKTINDDRISVSDASHEMSENPSPISDTQAFGFQAIQKTVQQIFPDVIVAPALVVGATDGRHYQSVADQVYRFLPVQLQRSDLNRIHGLNERISTENFHQAIRFYRQLLVNSCGE